MHFSDQLNDNYVRSHHARAARMTWNGCCTQKVDIALSRLSLNRDVHVHW